MEGLSPATTKDSEVPAILGVSSPVRGVASAHVIDVIFARECLMSYWNAVPSAPSSPGAVHVSVMDVDVMEDEARLDTADGAVVSASVPVEKV